ncbi:PAS fold family [Coleofasciculus chthonoplastes PCC 7420]|uniref:histidine kinase n=1 Tax=Coleofasciculus chthonoplastes PCC 7420 TaxID=118168 RepID=B4VSY1_9CYAN|nr:PAS domain S-box protein [Coleofasciculus chthonoplastes]EDX74796.1 PAS fold family [Coleofasciculus chthonoplastes PCC 7420]
MINTPVHLLLIDEDPDERALIIRQLQQEFSALHVAQPTNAKDLNQVLLDGHFDMAIADDELPWTTGIAVFKQVKRLQPACPFIMFTSQDSVELAVMAMKAGIDDYIIKSPSHYKKLVTAVRSALAPQLKSQSSRLEATPPITISQNLQLIATLQARVTQQTTIVRFSQYALRGIDIDSLMNCAVTLLAKTLDVDYAKVLELLPEGKALLLRAGVGWQVGLVGQATVDTETNSQAGYTLLSQEPIVVEDLRTESRFSAPPLLEDHGVVSGMSVIIPGLSLAKPGTLKHWDTMPNPDSQPFGILGIHSTDSRQFSQDDINFLQAIANILGAAIDRCQQAERLRILESAVNASSNGILISDPHQPDNPIIFVNSGFERLTGYSASELLGRNCRFLQGDDSNQAQLEEVRQAIATKKDCQITLRNYRKDGSVFWNDLYISPVRNSQGTLTHFLGVQTDVTAQKLALEKLRQQAQLLDLANDAIMVLDLQGKITYWNQGAQRLYGWSSQDAIGQNAHQLLHTIFPQALRDIKTQLWHQEYWPGELIQTTQDGTQITVASRWTLQRDHQGNPLAILEVNHNISAYKRTEKALRQSEQRFRLAVNHSPDMFVIYDAQRRFVFVNTTTLDRTGKSSTDYLGHRDEEIWSPEVTEWYLPTLKRVIETRTPQTVEATIRLPNTNPFTTVIKYVPMLNELGEIVQILGFTFDITQRKQLEIQLRQTIDRLQTLQTLDQAILAEQPPPAIAQVALTGLKSLLSCRHLSVVVFDWDSQQATLLATNGEMENLARTTISLEPFTSELAQFADHKIHQLKQSDIVRVLRPIVQALLSQNAASFSIIPLRSKPEIIGTLNLEFREKNDLDNEHKTIVQEVANQLAIAIAQSRLQQQLKRYTTELEERITERTQELQAINAELEAFSYTVSHDLRAPLRAMQGFANALVEDCGSQLDSIGLDYTQRITTAAQRLDKMIQDLLEYSRLGRLDFPLKPISLDSIMSEVLFQLQELIKNTNTQIKVAEKGVIPLPEVLGHRATLMQVVSNLIANAIKFVPETVQPQIQVWAEERKDVNGSTWIRLWIEDNGIGIESEYQEKIFLVFERLHGREHYPGSGIGLALVRKGMERLGGRSGVESSLHQGSRFWIEAQKVETCHDISIME